MRPTETSKRSASTARELTKRLGPAANRHVDPRRRRNLYLDDATTAYLASRKELSGTVRGLLAASRGTTAGRILEQQIEIDRATGQVQGARTDLVHHEENLRNFIDSLNFEGVDFNEVVASTEVCESLHVVEDLVDVGLLHRAGVVHDVLKDLAGLKGPELLAATLQSITEAQRESIKSGKLSLPPQRETDTRKLVDKMTEYVAMQIENVLRVAGIIRLGEEIVEMNQERLAALGAQWDKNAVRSLAGIAAAFQKHVEQCPDARGGELDVWAESFTVIFLQATGIRLDPDELLEVIRMYLEGGPPSALKGLRAYF